MQAWKEVLFKISLYKELQADIKEIDLEIETIEDKTTLLTNSERNGIQKYIPVNSNSTVEKTIIEKDKLKFEKNEKIRQIERIDNAISVLTDDERFIIKNVFIEKRKYYIAQNELNLSYQRIKQLEKRAAEKMEKYILKKKRS